MLKYSVKLVGLTIFTLALIWAASPGDASQNTATLASIDGERVLWADTTHIEVGEPSNQTLEPAPQNRDTFLKNVKKLTQTAFHLRRNYMEDIDVEEMVKSGIAGMLDDLDRYSVLMEQSAYDDLMEQTHGKYQGLGIQIDQKNDRIIVISPLEGTPAQRKGLRAGDIIWEINGESTEGFTTTDASKRMRGEAGTAVNLTIKRPGVAGLLDFEVERAVIELKSVNYYGVIPETDIGYVRLSRFAEETSHELREAIAELNDQNISGLVFDLRSNGGGLLDQAKETAELFLNPGKEIVYTKGKDPRSERHFRSERTPLLPEDKPLVILVDEGTASASEIVAGAIQDWDRGVILGSTTYGKGLVQQIFPVSDDGSLQVKLTTAKYYVPSGRCIQKPERQGKHPSEDEIDSLTIKEESEIYYTNGGRIVKGGGGIAPDVEIDRDTWQIIEINLERQQMFFDFAVKYVADHPDVDIATLKIDDEIIAQFKDFLKEKEFSYESALELAMDDFKKSIAEEDKEAEFEGSLNEISDLVEQEKSHDFEKSIDYVKKAIKREIVQSVGGERGYYEDILLKDDKAIRKAIDILDTPGDYGRLLTESHAAADDA